MSSFDLNKQVKDVPMEFLDQRAPKEQIESDVLFALYHIGRQSKRSDGFWISGGQICSWLEGNGMLGDITPRGVGWAITHLGFEGKHRYEDGMYRWIDRKLLMKLIEMNKQGSSVSTKNEEFMDDVKRLVFKAYLEDKMPEEIEELSGVDPHLITEATKAFIALDEEDARKWLEETE